VEYSGLSSQWERSTGLTVDNKFQIGTGPDPTRNKVKGSISLNSAKLDILLAMKQGNDSFQSLSGPMGILDYVRDVKYKPPNLLAMKHEIYRYSRLILKLNAFN